MSWPTGNAGSWGMEGSCRADIADRRLALTIARAQRHEFMNDLQVISGWLQLQRGPEAMAYLKSVSARLNRESAMLNRLPEAVAGVLAVGMILARHQGLPVTLEPLSPETDRMIKLRPGTGDLLRLGLEDGVAICRQLQTAPAVAVRLGRETAAVTFRGLGAVRQTFYATLCDRLAARAQENDSARGLLETRFDDEQVWVTLAAEQSGGAGTSGHFH
ncbi:MAG: Spo0B domain-containing protein [Thermaerobacterales bacterium]